MGLGESSISRIFVGFFEKKSGDVRKGWARRIWLASRPRVAAKSGRPNGFEAGGQRATRAFIAQCASVANDGTLREEVFTQWAIDLLEEKGSPSVHPSTAGAPPHTGPGSR